MRIVVVGPGALGCFFAARLAGLPDHEVWLLDHNKDRLALLESQGLKLIQKNGAVSIKILTALFPEEVGRPDLVLFCVKSYDVASAIERIKSFASGDNLLIALQNGIAHHSLLHDGYPGNWGVGVTAQGAALEGVGIVRHGGDGDTIIGSVLPEKKRPEPFEKAAQTLSQAGIPTAVSHDIRVHVWKKFIVNVGINALSAVLKCPNGQIVKSLYGRKRLAAAVQEAALVAAAKGIEIGADPVGMTEKVCARTSINISSMLQDVQRKKKTEIDAINGALVQEARLLGIAVPENEKLVREVKAIEAEYLGGSLFIDK